MLTQFLIPALVAFSPAPTPDGTNRHAVARSDFSRAMQAAEAAEIYLVRPGIEFPMRLTPEAVRTEGCGYIVYRYSPQWADLERSLAEAEIRIVPVRSGGDIRVGLVLSDARGILRELYANDEAWPNGLASGLDQRHWVQISVTFAQTLRSFAARHRELARSSPGRCMPALPAVAP